MTVTSITPDKIRLLKQVHDMERSGNGTVPSSPFARSLVWAQRDGLVRVPLESRQWCHPRLTDAGKALIEPNETRA